MKVEFECSSRDTRFAVLKRPAYQVIGERIRAKGRERLTQSPLYESLILAQDERWRRA